MARKASCLVPSLWKVNNKLGFTDFVLQNSTVTGVTNASSEMTSSTELPGFVTFQMCPGILLSKGKSPTLDRESHEKDNVNTDANYGFL